VLINLIELLCTAGLPALYTEILALQNLPAWKEYSYLALYNLAYMADDSLMVAIVVITLGRRRLQENEGRWLKLLSGEPDLSLAQSFGVTHLFLGPGETGPGPKLREVFRDANDFRIYYRSRRRLWVFLRPGSGCAVKRCGGRDLYALAL
jgi:hypothetical protein